jgi:hypothetical protein
MAEIRKIWARVRKKINYLDRKICRLMCSQHGIIVTAGTVIACFATLQLHAWLGIVFSSFSLYIKDLGMVWSEIEMEVEEKEKHKELAFATVRSTDSE